MVRLVNAIEYRLVVSLLKLPHSVSYHEGGVPAAQLQDHSWLALLYYEIERKEFIILGSEGIGGVAVEGSSDSKFLKGAKSSSLPPASDEPFNRSGRSVYPFG